MSVPPTPFSDEAGFKAWMKAGEENQAKVDPPADLAEPTAEENQLMEQLRPMIDPAFADLATDLVLNRFIRGYTIRTFNGVKDKVERTAIMVNLSLSWRTEIDLAGLPGKELPKRARWDLAWPQTYDGQTTDGQTIWYMMVPTNFSSDFSVEETALLHAQDMATLTKTKIELMAKKGRKFVGNHHALVVDMNSDRGSVSKSFMKFFKQAVAHPKGPNTTQHFFPDALSKAFIINTPMMYRALWGFAKLFMEPVTAAKYQMLGYDFMDKLVAGGYQRDALPMCIGGYGPNPRGHKAKIESIGRGKTQSLTLKPTKPSSKLVSNFEVTKSVNFKVSSVIAGVTKLLATTIIKEKKKVEMDLDLAKVYEAFVFEFENSDHKYVTVTYTIDLL